MAAAAAVVQTAVAGAHCTSAVTVSPRVPISAHGHLGSHALGKFLRSERPSGVKTYIGL